MSIGKAIVEFVGTFFLVFTITMVVIEPGAGALAPLAIGSVLMVMVYAGGHVSGAHYNPAVTMAVFLRGKCPAGDIAPYIIAQLLAAAAASGLALVFKDTSGLTPSEFEIVPTILAEVLFTFALVFVILNVATAKATAGNPYYGVAIGLTVLAGAYAVGGVSGGAFNPAVVLALGITGLAEWTDLWMHLIGNVGGALAAVAAFKVAVPDQS